MSERVELRVIAIGAEPAEHGAWAVDVSVGGCDGQVTLARDPVNGGYAGVGDSLDCWVSDRLCRVLLALDEATRSEICSALQTVGSRAIGVEEALSDEPPPQ